MTGKLDSKWALGLLVSDTPRARLPVHRKIKKGRFLLSLSRIAEFLAGKTFFMKQTLHTFLSWARICLSLTRRDYAIQFAGTLLGLIWLIAQYAFQIGIFFVIFGFIIKAGTLPGKSAMGGALAFFRGLGLSARSLRGDPEGRNAYHSPVFTGGLLGHAHRVCRGRTDPAFLHLESHLRAPGTAPLFTFRSPRLRSPGGHSLAERFFSFLSYQPGSVLFLVQEDLGDRRRSHVI